MRNFENATSQKRMLGYDIGNARIKIRCRYLTGLFHLSYDYPGTNALTLQDMDRVCIF